MSDDKLRYVAFKGESVEEMREYLDAGADEIRVIPHKDGRKWRIAGYKADVEMGSQNDSFPCPPFCG